MPDFARFAASLGLPVRVDEPMSRHTTFGIGGPADYFVRPRSADEMGKIMGYCRREELPFFVLGNGSNLLVSDAGIRGVVASTAGLRGLHAAPGDDGSVSLGCGAGLSLREVCVAARERALMGLEFAYGIPGSVGGAVYMNAGAYGGEMKDVTVSAGYVGNGKSGCLTGEELGFGYRRSAFTDGRRAVTEAVFRLRPGDRERIARRMEELMGRRVSKQPLELPSAGSVFRRPPGRYAGTLIDGCGLKGLRVGGAQVSPKHAGFIVNTGGATCADVRALIEKIRQEVFRQTGVEMEPEVKMVGI